MVKTTGLNPQNKTSISMLQLQYLMLLIGFLVLTEKMVLEGYFHMRPFQWHLKKELEISSVAGQPSSMVGDRISSS